MGLDLSYGYGQTPLEDDEKEGLRIKTIDTQTALDRYEQQNIELAVKWLNTKRPATAVVLTEGMLIGVHRRMFSDVWSWAGHFRRSQKNLGVDWHLIPPQLKLLLDDVQFQVLAKSYNADELAIRFKHRLVSIHCFANGNGRHSRLLADTLVESLGRSPFTWGQTLGEDQDPRRKYIQALKRADNEDYSSIIEFARS